MKLSPAFATTLLALALTSPATLAQTYQTGMRELTLADPAGARTTEGFVWYPTAVAKGLVRAHGNQVWEPIRVAPDAAPVAGRHPLVVLSHGMFGNARNQVWLAEGLVAAGYVVAAIDHPGTSTFQRDPDRRRQLWERPRDISRLIDELLSDPRYAALIDPDRIYMAGHSLGGFTAMELAGARFDSARFDGYCAGHAGDTVCGLFDDWQVAKTPEDRSAMAADLSDPRIRAFAVLDLGGTQTFSPESLAAIRRPLLVYGAPKDVHGLDLDIESRALVAMLPTSVVTYHEPPDLAHFDFLGLCTAQGLDILKEEEPDDVFVCQEGRDERKAEHDQVIREALAFFN